MRFGRFTYIPTALVAAAFALGVTPLQAGGVHHEHECKVGMADEDLCRAAMRIDQGFVVFTEETFEGNGRTCGTCHIPKEAYNIFPQSIKKLNKKEFDLLSVASVPGLENPELIRSNALFNISGGHGVCGADDPGCWATITSHEEGPVFRSTMGIFGLALTTNPADHEGPAVNFKGTPLLPPECSSGVQFPLPPDPTIDNVTAMLPQLGWAGDGSPGTPNGLPPGTDLVECRTHHGFADPGADGSFDGFAAGAIAQHATRSLHRILGVDFRLATPEELKAMGDFQLWLGRRTLTAKENAIQGTGTNPFSNPPATEFILELLFFKDPRVAKGRDFFVLPAQIAPPPNPPPGPPPPPVPNPTGGAGCNVCHVNAGARASFPGPQPPNTRGNINVNTDVELGSDDIGMTVVGAALPHDEGGADSFRPGGTGPLRPPTFAEAFNLQSIVEAAQKKSWFHNHRVTKDLEKAITFYTSDDFINGDGSPGSGAVAFTTLERMQFGNTAGTIVFPKGDGIEHLGAFLRSLNAFYNLRDCERLIDEAVQRIEWHISVKNPIRNCKFNLAHVQRILKESKLKKLHRNVVRGAHTARHQLDNVVRGARKARHQLDSAMSNYSKKKLLKTKKYIRKLRDSIAVQTSPPPA